MHTAGQERQRTPAAGRREFPYFDEGSSTGVSDQARVDRFIAEMTGSMGRVELPSPGSS